MSPGATTMRAPQHAVSTLSMEATGPVCIVTGGSRGLGRAIALALGGEGCRVVVNYAASAAAAEEVVAEIKKLGGDGVAVQADMSNMDGIKKLFAATAEAYDEPVGVLVNNAGITRDTLVMRMKEKQWTDVIDTNLNGTFWVTQAAFHAWMGGNGGALSGDAWDAQWLDDPRRSYTLTADQAIADAEIAVEAVFFFWQVHFVNSLVKNV